jgi:hypothetical protein
MSNENIFREVDEELRSERMRKLWRRFGPIVIGAAVAIVVLVAVNEGWSWWRGSQAAQSSERLYAAFDLAESGDVAGAQAALDDLSASGSGSYPTLARFREAGLLAAEGQDADAVAAYDAIANSESNSSLRELALVLAGRLLVDTGSLADVEARVGALAVEGNAMRNSAREALGLAQYKAEAYADAQANFEAILNDPLSQNSQRTRASFYLAQLLAEGAVDDEEAVAETIEPPAEADAPDAATPETAVDADAPALE